MSSAASLSIHAAPAWVVMWSLAAAIYFLCKLWTVHFAFARGLRPTIAETLSYLLLWPGMNAVGFLRSGVERSVPAREWLPPLGKALLGAILLWGVPRCVANPLLAGWIGMVGLILMLHFGLFGLLALGWQRLGRQAPLLMKRP